MFISNLSVVAEPITHPDFMWKEVGSRVRAWRIATGMTQQTLADVAGISQPGLHRIEQGQTNPQVETLQRVAHALKCSVRELLCGASAVDLAGDREFQSLVARLKVVFESGN